MVRLRVRRPRCRDTVKSSPPLATLSFGQTPRATVDKLNSRGTSRFYRPQIPRKPLRVAPATPLFPTSDSGDSRRLDISRGDEQTYASDGKTQ